VSNDRTEPTSVPQGTGAMDSSHTGSVSAREYRDREARIDRDPEATEARRREEFGGFNLGADFFGWLVAVAMAVLLAGIVGAVAAAVGSSLHVTQTDAQRRAGTFGLATAIALLVVLMVAYYAGGYVAGRMSRYDGGRQGFGVWLIGVLVTIVVVAVGILFGSQYDIFQRVNLPSVPIPSDTATWGGIITLAAILIGTLIAAFVGGKVGRRYHSKVDRVRS
jgi:hypothetical protein